LPEGFACRVFPFTLYSANCTICCRFSYLTELDEPACFLSRFSYLSGSVEKPVQLLFRFSRCELRFVQW
jgi:hypothetical protein